MVLERPIAWTRRIEHRLSFPGVRLLVDDSPYPGAISCLVTEGAILFQQRETSEPLQWAVEGSWVVIGPPGVQQCPTLGSANALRTVSLTRARASSTGGIRDCRQEVDIVGPAKQSTRSRALDHPVELATEVATGAEAAPGAFGVPSRFIPLVFGGFDRVGE